MISIGIVIACLICFCVGVLTGIHICEANTKKIVDKIIKEKEEHDKEKI